MCKWGNVPDRPPLNTLTSSSKIKAADPADALLIVMALLQQELVGVAEWE
jgi:hypothetical protein